MVFGIEKEPRIFSQRQRKKMLENQNNTCIHCGRRINNKTGKADHAYPYSAGGPTHIWNGQMLCNACHKMKTKSEHGTYYGKLYDPINEIYKHAKKSNNFRLDIDEKGVRKNSYPWNWKL